MSKRNPYWTQRECAAWCGSSHRKNDGGSDRDCMSRWFGKVVFGLMSPRYQNLGEYGQFHDKANAELYLVQPYRSDTASVKIEAITEDGTSRFELTLDEALKLAKLLTTAVDIAEGHANPDGES